MKYTALSLLEIAGVEDPAAALNKRSVNIAGVTVNNPDHIINMQDATEVTVIANDKEYTGELPKVQDEKHQDRVNEIVEAKGRALPETQKELKDNKQTE